MSGLTRPTSRNYLSISAGRIRKRVSEQTSTSEVREVTNPETGAKTIVNEEVFKDITGIISNVNLTKGDYGYQLFIDVIASGTTYTIITKFDSSYARTLLCRLPAADPLKEVCISPYQFEDENKKKRTGCTVKQDDIKLDSIYVDRSTDPPTNVNGYPEWPKGEYDDDDIKTYGIQVNKFLKAEFKSRIENLFNYNQEISTAQGEMPIIEDDNDGFTPLKEDSPKPKKGAAKGKGKDKTNVEDETDDLPF